MLTACLLPFCGCSGHSQGAGCVAHNNTDDPPQRPSSLIGVAAGAAPIRLIGSRIVADREIAATVAMVQVTSLGDDDGVWNRPPGYRSLWSFSFSLVDPSRRR